MIVFTKHALERIQQRNIRKEYVKKAIETSRRFLRDRYGHKIAQMKIDKKLLRVVFRRDGETILVITAYLTSRLDKYEQP